LATANVVPGFDKFFIRSLLDLAGGFFDLLRILGLESSSSHKDLDQAELVLPLFAWGRVIPSAK
jgi:hypothetical protein